MATADSTATYKDITGFPGYRVGDDGSVWSCWRKKSLGVGYGTHSVIDPGRWQRLKPNPSRTGYLTVALRRDGKYTYLLVHRLVLEAFVGPCPDDMECRHLDGVPSHNHLGNLAWGTRLENHADKRLHGTNLAGVACHFSKLTDDAVRSMRHKYATKQATQVQLAEEHGITQANVSEIVRRRTWKHVE